MTDRIRLLTLNLLSMASAEGPARHEVVKRVLPTLGADVVALQEATRNEQVDQVRDLVGPDVTVVDLPGGHPTYGGECLATRCPVLRVDLLDDELAGGGRAAAAAVEILGPDRLGPLLVVHHKGTYELHLELVREQQALATARFVDDLVRDRPALPVVLLGDFNAAPDSASIRFLTGRQSLGGLSVRYESAWEAAHGDQPGLTFEPGNPLVRAGQMPLERGRRIDHVLTRSGPHGALLDVADARLVFTGPVDGVWASDHYGVLVDLQRPGHPPGQWAPG